MTRTLNKVLWPASYLWEAGDKDLDSLRGRWDHHMARESSLTGERQQGMNDNMISGCLKKGNKPASVLEETL